MQFLWFWSFWHWSVESHRCEALLRSPLHGIASHWDEWFRHEATDDERAAIACVSRSDEHQRRFIAWLARRWAREAAWKGEHPPPRFVLGQLATVSPFDRWRSLEPYRASYGSTGLAAVILAEGSAGEAADVRPVHAVVVPPDGDADAAAVVAEGFHADGAELATAHRAATGLLDGRGLLLVLGLWLAAGRRPYPRWLGALLAMAWCALAAGIAWLLVGPDPGHQVRAWCAALATLWVILVLTAAVSAGVVGLRTWREGRALGARLRASQVRLRMAGGLTLRGGSAGLPFCLGALLALHEAQPAGGRRSWVWRHFFRRLREDARAWAATGVVTADGRIHPVVLEPKLRACLLHADVARILTPRQRDAGDSPLSRAAHALGLARRSSEPPAAQPDVQPGGVRLGYAAASHRLRSYPIVHLAQAVLAIGGLGSGGQGLTNVLAVATSALMVAALPDLRNILAPPPAPPVMAPSSTSPYHLWVSLGTTRPEAFRVLLESGFWANRRADVSAQSGERPSARAVIPLRRLGRGTSEDPLDGTVWVERRQGFLGREFAPGERVGRYTISYVAGIGR